MNFGSQSLAKMHALGISMRRKQPGIFNSKIIPHLQVFPRKNLASGLKVIFAYYLILLKLIIKNSTNTLFEIRKI